MTEPFALSQCKTMTTSDFERLTKLGDYLMEPKVDGWRMQVDVSRDAVQMWTRTNHDATGKMPVVEQHLQHLAGIHSFRLDGEAVYIDPATGIPDYLFTASCLGSHRETCVMKQGGYRDLSFFVFDILQVDGHDVRGKSLGARKTLLKRFLSNTGNVQVILGDEPTYEQHTKNFEQYLEGSVLKDIGSAYAGKRHKSWMKWKEIETVDVRIIGYKEGQGKFEGLIGAIEFMAPDGTKGFCSGMDDSTRIWISDHRADLLGHIIEIKHFGKMVDGYRHPQFQRFREDKI